MQTTIPLSTTTYTHQSQDLGEVIMLRNLSGPQMLDAMARLSKHVREAYPDPEHVTVGTQANEMTIVLSDKSTIVARQNPKTALWSVHCSEAFKLQYHGGQVQRYK